MKSFGTAILCCFLLGGVGTLSCQGPREQARFFVEGNCLECKVLIERAALAQEGVASANWEEENSQLEVSYHSSKINLDRIQEAVAQAGFSTQYFPADPEARKQLPLCCQEIIQRKLTPDSPH